MEAKYDNFEVIPNRCEDCSNFMTFGTKQKAIPCCLDGQYYALLDDTAGCEKFVPNVPF